MDDAPQSNALEEVTFTNGVAYGSAAHDRAPCVELTEEQRARLDGAIISLRRELYDGNPYADQPCGEEIV